MASDKTRAAILEAAEALFARKGFSGVGLREIARAAGVHPNSVNYHFGDKLGCLEALYQRHTGPMNARRRELIGEAGRIADLDERLRAVLRGYLLPAFLAQEDEAGGARFTRLRAMLSAESDPQVRAVIARSFDDTSRLLIDALADCLPGIDRAALAWQSQFLLGALYYTLINPDRIGRLADGAADGQDHARAIEEITRSAHASLKALASR